MYRQTSSIEPKDFRGNAGLVANSVLKNLNKVGIGTYITFSRSLHSLPHPPHSLASRRNGRNRVIWHLGWDSWACGTAHEIFGLAGRRIGPIRLCTCATCVRRAKRNISSTGSSLRWAKPYKRLLSTACRRRCALLSVPPFVKVCVHVPFPPVLPNDSRSVL